MKLLRRLPHIVSQRNFALVCCMLAYLLLTIHDLTPHHHEEDIAAHNHGHSHARAHHHHTRHSHSQINASHQNQECLLFVHHITADDGFIAASAFKKKLLTDYCPAPGTLINSSEHICVLREYKIGEAHPLLLSHQYSEAPRGPPQA